MVRTLSLLASLCLLSACGGRADSVPPEAPADTARVVALPTSQLPEDAEGPLVVYTGRSEGLAAPLIQRFRERTGLEVEVRYADDAALLAMLAAEGDRSPADVLWGNSAGAMGTAAARNLLTVLPDSMRVLPGQFVPISGRWLPLTVRFRVLAYAPDRVDKAALPTSIIGLPDVAALNGRLGWTPAYSSFQDFLTAVRLEGNDGVAADWLDAMMASGAKAYASNEQMLDALATGAIDAALINHHHVLLANEDGADLAFHTFAAGDPGNLGTVTGAGVLDTSARQRAARQFVSFLLSAEAQTFAAENTKEIPVVAGAEVPSGYLTFEAAAELAPRLDVERFRDFDGTLALLRTKGLMPEAAR